MGEGARGRWLGSDGRWRPGPPPEGWWQERGGGGRWYPPALANHPAARRPPGMPRPWARERDDADDRDAAGDTSDGGDPPSGVEGGGDEGSADDPAAVDDPASFPTLDPPWPDGELPGESAADVPEPLDPADVGAGVGVGGELSPVLRLEPSWDEPPPCRVPRRPLRPEHRRRSRHSFEPADLNDVELDRLLRGRSMGGGGRGGGRPGGRPGGQPTATRPWPVWAKVVLAAAAVLAGLGVLGALEATAGDTTDTITTRGEGQRPVRAVHGPTSTSSAPPVGELREMAPPVVPVPVLDDVDCPGRQGDGNRDDEGC